MYIPKKFRNTDLQSVKDFIHKNGFGILVTSNQNKPWATHIPFILDINTKGKEFLLGHISKGNLQWKQFERDEEVLVIFNGPHAYVSSSWYDHENVPTWNYIAVHVYGKVRIVEGEELKKQLSKLVDKHESEMNNPVSVEKMSDEFYHKEIKGIVGFEIEITEIQAASKLSQNRDDKNRSNIIKELDKKTDVNSKEIAEFMKGIRK